MIVVGLNRLGRGRVLLHMCILAGYVLTCSVESTTSKKTNESNISENKLKADNPECIIAPSAFSEKAKVTSVCWSQDSTKVAATSDDGFVKVFNVGTSITGSKMHTVHRDLGREVSINITNSPKLVIKSLL